MHNLSEKSQGRVVWTQWHNLGDKIDMVQKWKAEGLKLHVQRLDVERRKQDESQKQRQEMI